MDGRYVVTRQLYYNAEQGNWVSQDQATIFADANDAMLAMYRGYEDSPVPDGVCIRREGGADLRPEWERIDGNWQQRGMFGERQAQDWKRDARRALLGIYTDEAIDTILEWFDYLKGRKERELVGNDVVDALGSVWDSIGDFDVYRSMMVRLFLYAPFILKEASESQGDSPSA